MAAILGTPDQYPLIESNPNKLSKSKIPGKNWLLCSSASGVQEPPDSELHHSVSTSIFPEPSFLLCLYLSLL